MGEKNPQWKDQEVNQRQKIAGSCVYIWRNEVPVVQKEGF